MDAAKLAGIIVATILERPTCVRCISAKISATKMDTLLAMRRLVGAVPVEMHVGERCRVCDSTSNPVYVAARP